MDVGRAPMESSSLALFGTFSPLIGSTPLKPFLEYVGLGDSREGARIVLPLHESDKQQPVSAPILEECVMRGE